MVSRHKFLFLGCFDPAAGGSFYEGGFNDFGYRIFRRVDHQLKQFKGYFTHILLDSGYLGLMEIADHIIKSHNGHVCGNL